MSRITDPATAAHFFRRRMNLEIEEVWAAALSSEKKVIAAQCLFRGTVDFCPAHPRDIFRFACLHNAAALIVAHNHPGGSAKPSPEDLYWTERLLTASEILQIPIVDHLIVTKRRHFSFLVRGFTVESETPSGRNRKKVTKEGDQKEAGTEKFQKFFEYPSEMIHKSSGEADEIRHSVVSSWQSFNEIQADRDAITSQRGK